ncbi:ankyrin repeat domain-containing protein [Joostella sp. CR20]|uniref:ankyrin repeat domain-containing protein n=1 Tax=Joostella sp. CR20 TaxID=2804312 RepID=UPI00313DC487
MKKLAFVMMFVFATGSIFASSSENKKTLETAPQVSVLKKSPKVSPFCMSIVKGDFDTVKKLIDLGADVNEKSNGLTPAMYAAKFNRVDILELLINNEANVKAKCSEKGFTAMDYAKLSNAHDAIGVLEKALNS